jgi:hypothetical protein
MKKKRLKYSPFALGSVPVTNIEVAKPETAQEFRNRLAREEQERKDKPFVEAQAALTQTLRQLHKTFADFWSLPLDTLRHASEEAFASSYVELGLARSQVGDAELGTVAAFATQVIGNYITTLAPRTGFELSGAGEERLRLFVRNQIIYGRNSEGFVAISPSSLASMFQWLCQNEVFPDDEVSFDAELKTVADPEPEPTPEPTFEEILTTKGTVGGERSREQERQLRVALNNAVIGQEFHAMFAKFHEHMQREFNVTMTETVYRNLWRWFQDMNKSPLDPKAFDAGRRFLVSRNFLPANCITVRERIESEHRAGRISDREMLRQTDTFTQTGLIDRPVAAAGL